MKKVLYIIMALVLASSALAVSRTTGTGTITYSKQNIPSPILKGYWAVEDTVSGCTFSSVSCGASSYYSCSKSGSAIRVVAHSDDSGGNLPSSVQVTVSGSGTCTLSMYHVESWKTTTATVTGASTGPVAGSVNIGVACNNVADTTRNCKIDFTEFTNYANLWLGGTVDFSTQFVPVASAWLTQSTIS